MIFYPTNNMASKNNSTDIRQVVPGKESPKSYIDFLIWKRYMLILLLVLFTNLAQNVSAQRIRFKDVNGHMIAKVTLNGNTSARALIDTGSSISILDSTFIADSGIKLNMEDCRRKIRFPAVGKTLFCRSMLTDTLTVDGLRSSRPVYVADLSKIISSSSGRVDMLMGSCYKAEDGSRMLTLSIADGYVEYGRRTLPEKKYKKGIMTLDEQGFVGTDAPLRILTKDYVSGQIVGRFLIDTGNPGYFFLCGKNEKVASFLTSKNIELEERYNKGKTYHYFKMDSAEMLGKEVNMEKKVIPVYPIRMRGDYAGAIGNKFLNEVELVLDYDNNFLYIR